MGRVRSGTAGLAVLPIQALRMRTPGGVILPYPLPTYSLTELVLIGEGTDTGTLIRDRSGNLRALTLTGSAQVDTDVNLQGTSILLTETTGGGYIGTPSTADMRIGTSTDFWGEAFIYPATLPTHGTIMSNRAAGSGTYEFDVYVQNDGSVRFETFTNVPAVAGYALSSASAISTSTAYHVAWSRQGTTLRLFINGALVASGTQAGTIGANTSTFYVGGDGSDLSKRFNGNLNGVRYGVGEARFTANFVAPTSADFFSYVEGTAPQVGLNAYDKAANITLSNGWRTATKTTADAVSSVRGTRGIAYTDSGYFEVRIDAGVASTFMMHGIGNSSASLSQLPGGNANSWGYYQDDGHKWFNNVDGGAYGTTYKTNGDIVMVAFKNGKVWFGKNGTWVGDPAAGTGEAYSGITGTLYPQIGIYRSTATAHQVTARFHPWEFTYSAPSGFNAWDV